MPSTRGFTARRRGLRDSTGRSQGTGLASPGKTDMASECGGEDWMQGGAG
jgi:hypothetical protein